MAFGGFGGGAPSPFGGVQQQPQSPFGGGGASAFGTPNAFGAPTGASNGGNAFGGGTPGASGAFGAAQTSPGAVANACKFWNRGSCKFGARCNNKHVCSKCGSTAHRAVNCSVGGGSGYRATRVMDKELLSPGTSYAMVHSISAMPENLSKSVEEIRATAYASADQPAAARGERHRAQTVRRLPARACEADARSTHRGVGSPFVSHARRAVALQKDAV